MVQPAPALVVIPTYNEKANITALLPQVLRKDKRLHVLVVDDGSPDGTAQAVRAAAKKFRAACTCWNGPPSWGWARPMCTASNGA
jgi:glycosyltransferase involved in cell wall biosynthesis